MSQCFALSRKLGRLGAVGLLGLGGLMLAACAPYTLVVGMAPGDQTLQEKVVLQDARRVTGRVALIDVSGLLINAPRRGVLESGPNPVSDLAEQLQRAAEDASVRAVVLRLNTPGGGVTATDLMYREVQRFRERTGKPVIALGMDVMASGGYYMACAADEVVVAPTAIVGSIGVILQTISFEPALRRLGVQAEAITSGPNKDAGSMLSTLSPQQRALFQTMIDEFYAGFLAVVQRGRPQVPAERWVELADGRVFSGERSVAEGLADHTGDLYTAYARARDRAGLDRAALVRYHRPLAHVGSPHAVFPVAGGTQINLAPLNLGQDTLPVGAYYLWSLGGP